MKSADVLYDEAFSQLRDPRSDAYKKGVLQGLKWRIEGQIIERPYKIGTAELDAFFAGVNEASTIYCRERDQAVAAL